MWSLNYEQYFAQQLRNYQNAQRMCRLKWRCCYINIWNMLINKGINRLHYGAVPNSSNFQSQHARRQTLLQMPKPYIIHLCSSLWTVEVGNSECLKLHSIINTDIILDMESSLPYGARMIFIFKFYASRKDISSHGILNVLSKQRES